MPVSRAVSQHPRTRRSSPLKFRRIAHRSLGAGGSAPRRAKPAPLEGRPIRVGVTGRSRDSRALTEYFAALRAAGAEPCFLENDPGAITADLARVDGLCFTGGLDVDPQRYQAERHPKTEPAAPERDAYEIDLMRAARERDVPVFAICRGIQIANVAFGGTLLQDIPDLVPGALTHSRPGVRSVIPEHGIDIEPASRLAAVAGTRRLATGSRHHQAIGRVAGDLEVVAGTGDGVIEALEPRFRARFWLAVQWHPESTVDDDGGASRALFRSFVEAASQLTAM
jgi:putative glutamine amidotransferase